MLKIYSYLRLAQSGEVTTLRHPQAALMRVAGNLAIDHLRRRASAARGLASLAVIAQTQEPVDDQDELERLRALILDLPQPYRDAFLLSRFGHLTHRQIAETLQVSVRTIEWRISQALAICARRLND